MQITKFLTSSQILSGLLLALLGQGQAIAAVTCTTQPDCYVSGALGSAGKNASSPVDIGTTQSGYDTNRFTSTTGYELWVVGDISLNTPYKTFEHLYFGDANLTQNMDVVFHSSRLDGSDFNIDAAVPRSVQLSQLNLNHVNFETTPGLQFFGIDNQINLTDSNIKISGEDVEIKSGTSLTINAAGESSFYNFFGQHRPASVTINLAPNSTLLFDHSGSLSSFASNSDKLYFSSPVSGNVNNNSTLKFRYSNVYFNSTDFDITDNSTLDLFGSGTKVEFEKLSLASSSRMTLGNNTTLTARNLYLGNATIDLESAAKINTNIVYVTDTTTLAGPGGNKAGINTIGFVLSDNTTFNQNSSRVAVSGDFFLNSGSVFNIDSAWFSAKETAAYGGTVNVTNGGDFVIAGGFILSNRDATFNIDPTSYLRVNSNAELVLGAPLVINNSGLLTVDGYLSGNGTIAGSGTVMIAESGQIDPGASGGNKINTITFENSVGFNNIGLHGNQSNQNQYYVDIDVVGGIETNDLLQYDDSDFDITGLTSIKVNTASAKTADELDGKSFTVISSVDAGSAGTLTTGGSYPTIVEGGDVPALINFTIFDNSTNGKDDLTLQADKNLDNLLKHPSVVRTHRAQTTTTSRPVPGNPSQTATTATQIIPQIDGTASQLVTITTTDNGSGAILSSSTSTSTLGNATGSRNNTAGANLLINASSTGNTNVNADLNTLTNSQVASSVGSIHAEPYSSYMTVSLEHTDSVMNTVMSHAAQNGGFSTGATQEVKEQQTGKRSWMDVSYADGKVDGSDDLGNFDYTLSSLTIGQDLMQSGDQSLGAYFSFGTQKMDEHDSANQDFSSDTYHLGLYLNQANIGAWDLRGVLGYAFSDHESKRQVSLSGSSTIAEADYNSHSAYVGVKGTITGYENDWVTLSPELGLSYIYYSQESIKEAGDPNLSLNIDSADTHAIVASAGLNARFASLSGTMSIYPLAFSRYEHDFYANDNNEHEIDAALVAHPDFKQPFIGQNRGEHAIVSGIGLGSDITSALQINGGFDYSVSNHGREWGAGFNLEYYW